MSVDQSQLAAVSDLDLLTGPDAAGPLAAAVGAAGGRLLSWRVNQVDHQPGRGTTVGYQARVGWWDGRATGERLAATTARAPDGTLVLDDGVDRVGVWRFPHDPYLPALPVAADPVAAGRLLHELGYGGGLVRVRTRAYRPGRRAVIEASTERGRLFLKVVRPRKITALHERHRLLTGAGIPAPPSLGFTPDGLLVLQALPGRTLRQVLMGGGAVPSAWQVLALLDLLPAQLADGPAQTSWLDKAPHFAAVIAAALPEQAAQATDLAVELTELTADLRSEPVTAVHGDLYESQLLVTGGHISGLLDVDTAGAGHRADDLACLLGHLSVLAQIDRRHAPAINWLGAAWLAAFEPHVDPAGLRRRTAAVVLSLATGPHRVQEPGWPAATRTRLDLAAAWLASVHTMNTPVSAP